MSLRARPDSARSTLSAPLLPGPGREDVVLLQEQVVSLERNLQELKQKVLQIEGTKPSSESESQGGPELQGGSLTSAGAVPELRGDHEGTAADSGGVNREKSWHCTQFAGEEPGIFKHLDEELFIAVLDGFFNYIVPDWHKASINPDGSLDLHGGPAARGIPFLAMVLAFPTYMLLPFFGTWHVLRHGGLTFRRKFEGFARTAGLSWCAWVIVLYSILGHPVEDATERQHTTILTLGFPLWSLAWFGYDLANRRLISSCDKAVERSKIKVRQDAKHVNARTGGFTAVLKALADPADGTSLFPMFTTADVASKTASLPSSYRFSCIALVAAQVLYALYPCLEKPCGPWPTVLNLTAAFAIGYAAYGFCFDLVMKLIDFNECVDQVQAFVYLLSPKEVRRSRERQVIFLKLVQKNCESRERSAKHPEYNKKIAAPPEGWVGKWQEWRKRINAEVEGEPDDLPLDVRRFEVELSNVSGVKLFRHLHSWLSADVVNERFGIDTSASILVVIMLFLMGVALAPLVFAKHMDAHHVSLAQTVALTDIVMSLVYMGLCCNHCVEMNDLLFERIDRVLLQWKEHASDQEGTIAKVWTGPPENYTCLRPGTASTTSSPGPVEVRAAIDSTRERLTMQAPQRILGMKVTKTLRAQLLSTLGGGVAAVAVPLIKKHLVQ